MTILYITKRVSIQASINTAPFTYMLRINLFLAIIVQDSNHFVTLCFRGHGIILHKKGKAMFYHALFFPSEMTTTTSREWITDNLGTIMSYSGMSILSTHYELRYASQSRIPDSTVNMIARATGLRMAHWNMPQPAPSDLEMGPVTLSNESSHLQLSN